MKSTGERTGRPGRAWELHGGSASLGSVASRQYRCTRRTTVITLTESASTKVRELIAQEGQDDLMLRVAVRPGGCSGFSYEMFFDSEKDAEDMVNTEFGVPVVVDPSSAQLLTGATLDYKDGLQGAGFAIDNPNAQKTCGCGNSFS